MGVIGTKASEFSSLLFTTFPNRFTSPTQAKSLKLVCNVTVYILYGNRKSENSRDYVQTSMNCMFMNSASDDIWKLYCVLSAMEWGGGGGGAAGEGRQCKQQDSGR